MSGTQQVEKTARLKCCNLIFRGAVLWILCNGTYGCTLSDKTTVRTYPDILPIARDIHLSTNAPPELRRYVAWFGGPGSTNSQFQRWLADRLHREGTSSLTTEHL